MVIVMDGAACQLDIMTVMTRSNQRFSVLMHSFLVLKLLTSTRLILELISWHSMSYIGQYRVRPLSVSVNFARNGKQLQPRFCIFLCS